MPDGTCSKPNGGEICKKACTKPVAFSTSGICIISAKTGGNVFIILPNVSYLQRHKLLMFL